MPNTAKKTNYRWVICAMLFFATTVNYLDRQVLSLTFEDFIRPEFHWTNNHYGTITGIFSLFYAIAMLFAGRLVDKLDTKKGYLWSIGIWSAGACVHALCGIATGACVGMSAGTLGAVTAADTVAKIATISMTFFLIARCILAVGEAGNFPAAIKATAEYFPKKDRAFSTSIFNAGSTVGALIAPFCIPPLAAKYGWEAAFIIIGALGFIWMGFWIFVYKKPDQNPKVNALELEYINQDKAEEEEAAAKAAIEASQEKKISLWKCFSFKQTWAFIVGKGLTDGVWWFFLFWMPSFLKNVYGMSSTDTRFQIAIGALYLIVMISILGGYLPTIFINKGMNPYAGRMKAMLIFAFFPLVALAAQPLAHVSYWIPVALIGIAAAAHQSWSANIFSTVGDMFPKSTIATITGIGGMAGGLGSFFIQKGAGLLLDASEAGGWDFLGAHGIQAGYFMMFCYCAIAYLLAWVIMKVLVPKYKPIVL